MGNEWDSKDYGPKGCCAGTALALLAPVIAAITAGLCLLS